jgi:hypothetical protein
MIVALIVGAFTAWYLGLRAGAIAGAVSLVGIVLSSFIPGASLTVYGLVVAWCALVYFWGARLAGKNAAATWTDPQAWLRKVGGLFRK